jgi:hypothetical protein
MDEMVNSESTRECHPASLRQIADQKEYYSAAQKMKHGPVKIPLLI